MDEVFDTCCFQFVHTSRSTGNDKHSAAVQCLECRNCIFRIFIITWTDYDNISFGSHSCFYSSFYRFKSEIINHFITGTSQEVARILCTCLTHSQITDSQHECFRTFAGCFRFETQCFKLAGSTVEYQCIHIFLTSMVFSTTAAFCFNRLLISGLFIEVRELVSTQQYFTTLGHRFMTGFITFVDSSLNSPRLQCYIETTGFFYRQEQVPCLLCNRNCQVFNIIRAGSRVNYFIEMRFFLQQ